MSAGFSDSYIRVFSLNQSKLRCVKQRDALGVIDPLAGESVEAADSGCTHHVVNYTVLAIACIYA